MHFQSFVITIAALLASLALARVPFTPTQKYGPYKELSARDDGWPQPQPGCAYWGG